MGVHREPRDDLSLVHPETVMSLVIMSQRPPRNHIQRRGLLVIPFRIIVLMMGCEYEWVLGIPMHIKVDISEDDSFSPLSKPSHAGANTEVT